MLARRVLRLVAATITYNIIEAIGIVLAAVSLCVMPGLSYAQRRAGRDAIRRMRADRP